MSIDFFISKCQTENVKDKIFGICDDEDLGKKAPAYLDLDNKEKWIAIVENQTDIPINFTAIDNCVDIFRADGTQDCRCDAMLTNVDHIVFIELKDQKRPTIANKYAEKQLQTTIDHFKLNHDLNKYKFKRAYICNKKRPNFNVGYQSRKNSFYKKNLILLFIQTQIVFKDSL